MDIQQTEEQPKKVPFLSKIISVLFGIFITTLLLAILTKELETAGIFIAIILIILMVFSGFYYVKKGTRLRMIIWGMLITSIILTALYFGLLQYIKGFSL